MIRRLPALCLLLCLLPWPALAASGPAADVTGKCVVNLSVNKGQKDGLLSEALNHYWDGGTDGVMTVTLPANRKAQGVMLALYGRRVPALIVESLDGEEPAEIARYTRPYHNDFIRFSRPVHKFRVRNADGRTPMVISRINVLTEGKLPDWVQRWEPPLDGADIQLIACHPDDEVLWFGGLLPTYAGQRRKKVQVTFVHTGTRLDRRNELLDALWSCGIRNYPNLPDAEWTRDVPAYVVSALRQTKAEVVVTQDVRGEYGNVNHIEMVAAVTEAVTRTAGDPEADPASAARYGAWQPKKLYVHLWPENESVFDWNEKLPALGGRSGYQIARVAFGKHKSQQSGLREVLMEGPWDCRRLGLYFTLVGPDDTSRPDLLQHIVPKPLFVFK